VIETGVVEPILSGDVNHHLKRNLPWG
jgi:hypothetical protein